ncbi:MAG: amidohydrolase [Melioribacteraceae bacterium]|nr:amidohydrolase [Melioribacteraceae bacterium]
MKFKTAFINGKIYTADDSQKWTEAIVISGNKIIFTGSNSEAHQFIDNQTEVINLNSKLVLPGFIDSHAHIVMGGFYLQSIDLSGVSTPSGFREKMAEYISRHPGRWVTEGNWNHENWKNGELPRKEWIDDFSRDTPVFVVRMDYHMGLANSRALELAGISRHTPDPAGGKIVRDPITGEPTGILKDKAMELVYNVIPYPTDAEYKSAILNAMNEARRFGVTSIHDITYKNHLKHLQKAEREGYLTCRVYSRLPIELNKNLTDAEIQYNFGSDKLKIGSVKAFADGSLGSSTAYFFEPYSDDNTTCGLAMDILQDGSLKDWMLYCDANRLQLSIHAIGDRAVSEILDIVEIIEKQNPAWDRRFRLEHAQHIKKADIERCSKLGVFVSAQPYHLYYDGDYMEKKIGRDRLKEAYTFKSFIRSGVKLCFGSDWSVVSLNPLTGIYAAVTRQTSNGKYKDGINGDEKLTVEEAVKCYTINAAFASYSENLVGSIKKGKFADFVVLDKNIFEIEPKNIKDVVVKTTVFDGEIVYEM